MKHKSVPNTSYLNPTHYIDMAITIQKITHFLEELAPSAYQENYDNSGLLVGNSSESITGILVSLDMTEAVIDEAKKRNCNLIVAHHPIIFGGLKKLTGKNYVERTVIKAIKEDIALYAIHTNLDNVQYGVNAKISEKLGLQQTKILSPKKEMLTKLTVFVPQENKDALIDALGKAGAGSLGNYSHCSFQTNGRGTFMPSELANPHIGQANELSEVEEVRVEMVLPSYLESKVFRAMKQAHPYEEVAYFMQKLENENQTIGAGVIGTLSKPMEELAFLQFLKTQMQTGCVKYTHLRNKPIKKVALCGGAGNFLRFQARVQGADIFITGDCKYHEFFDADGQMVIADIGHYESEQFTKDLLADWLQDQFDQLPVYISHTVTNPIHYL